LNLVELWSRNFNMGPTRLIFSRGQFSQILVDVDLVEFDQILVRVDLTNVNKFGS